MNKKTLGMLVVGIGIGILLYFLSPFYLRLAITPYLDDFMVLEYGEYASTYRIKFSTWFISTTTLRSDGIFRFHASFTGGDEKVIIPHSVYEKYDWEKAQVKINQFYLRLKKDLEVWMDVPAQAECKVVKFSYSWLSDHIRPIYDIECKVDVQKYADMYNTRVGFIRVRRGVFTIIAPLLGMCECSEWQDVGCGVSPCSPFEMKQTRSCFPSGCDIEERCVPSIQCIERIITNIGIIRIAIIVGLVSLIAIVLWKSRKK